MTVFHQKWPYSNSVGHENPIFRVFKPFTKNSDHWLAASFDRVVSKFSFFRKIIKNMNGRKLKHELWSSQLLTNSGPIFSISTCKNQIKYLKNISEISEQSYKIKNYNLVCFSNKNDYFETSNQELIRKC